MPGLVQAHDQYSDQDVVFISLTEETDLDRGKIEQFIQDFGITWRVGYAANRLMDALGNSAFPTLYVFDRQGRLTWSGHSTGSTLSGEIEQAMQSAHPRM